jgi:hypothetical protein
MRRKASWGWLAAQLVLAGATLVSLLPTRTSPTHAATVEAQLGQALSLTPRRVGTAGQSRCGTSVFPLNSSCVGFDGRDVRNLPDLWVVGFENNRDRSQKHVLQTVAIFDLAPLQTIPRDATLSRATLGYSEASTVRRSPGGDSEYGILPTCNTVLGVPTDGWDGSFDAIIPTRPATVDGVRPATTGDSGAWDVTSQVRQWMNSGASQGAFVLRGDDESPDIRAQAMCLSYVFDLGLTVEFISRG